jgi:hypothetical protein
MTGSRGNVHHILGEDVMGNSYRLGREYKDTGSSTNPEDQFLRWLNLPGSGMLNMPGIRPFKFMQLKLPVHAYVVLVTHERSASPASNPWEDTVDLNAGRIIYWGDAKFDEKRGLDDFRGNRALRTAYDLVLGNERTSIPPILHFSKPKPGVVRFNGLCVFDRLELTWFEDRGRPVRNYRAHLTVLDVDEVEIDWLHRRVRATSPAALQGDGPRAWRRYLAGEIDRLQIWAPKVRSRESQLPASDSEAGQVLGQLVSLPPAVFEGAVVSLFQQVDVVHQISQTRLTADGGFDFEGSFKLPPPLEYSIDFRGEVKRYARGTAVGPKDVSRLVARLGRGQYGLFVTTSYFTRQAQVEVLEDRYPTRLFAGADVVRFMRELRIVRGPEISPVWLEAIDEKARAS